MMLLLFDAQSAAPTINSTTRRPPRVGGDVGCDVGREVGRAAADSVPTLK